MYGFLAMLLGLGVLAWLTRPDEDRPARVLQMSTEWAEDDDETQANGWRGETPEERYAIPGDCGRKDECPWNCPECPRSNADREAQKLAAFDGTGLWRPDQWWRLGRKIECPKCAARNQERAKNGLEPIPMHFKPRRRDGAIYCLRCLEAVYPMSDDTVIKYDERYHRK